jgi:hypothetical protein
MIMAQSKIKLSEMNKRFYWRSYFGVWFFGGLVFLAWPNKHPIQSEMIGAVHLDHFVDAVPVFVLFLFAVLWCLVRSIWLAPRLRRAVKKEKAAYHPLIWMPLLGLGLSFVFVGLVVFAFGYPLFFLVLVTAITCWGIWLHIKGRKSLERA